MGGVTRRKGKSHRWRPAVGKAALWAGVPAVALAALSLTLAWPAPAYTAYPVPETPLAALAEPAPTQKLPIPPAAREAEPTWAQAHAVRAGSRDVTSRPGDAPVQALEARSPRPASGEPAGQAKAQSADPRADGAEHAGQEAADTAGQEEADQREVATGEARTVTVVGDSLTVELKGSLKRGFARAGWKLLWVDARVGRGVDEGLGIVRDRRASDTIVIALGTNDYLASNATVREWVNTASGLAGNGRQVAWVNLHMNPDVNEEFSNYLRINEQLEKAAKGTDNVRVFDWASFARHNGISTGSDGVHYPYDTCPIRAKFYVAAALRLAEMLSPEQSPLDAAQIQGAGDQLAGALPGTQAATREATAAAGPGGLEQ